MKVTVITVFAEDFAAQKLNEVLPPYFERALGGELIGKPLAACGNPSLFVLSDFFPNTTVPAYPLYL